MVKMYKKCSIEHNKFKVPIGEVCNCHKQHNKKRRSKKKNNILIKIVDLHPSRVAAYNTKGVLVYANRYYIDTNELKLSDINHLHFSQISQCNVGFENILEQLRTKSSFIVQKMQDNLWFESVFYSIEQE